MKVINRTTKRKRESAGDFSILTL